jgi:hypothetical protein
MQQTAAIAVLLGLVIAALGWFAGRWSPAARSRQAIGSLNSSARRQLASHGFRTGRFGIWLSRYRTLVRTLVIVLAVIWLFALRPLSAGDIFLVLIVALVVTWILELLQVRPDEAVVTDEPVLEDADPYGTADTLVIDADTVVVDDANDTEVILETTDASTDASAPAEASAKKPRS